MGPSHMTSYLRLTCHWGIYQDTFCRKLACISPCPYLNLAQRVLLSSQPPANQDVLNSLRDAFTFLHLCQQKVAKSNCFCLSSHLYDFFLCKEKTYNKHLRKKASFLSSVFVNSENGENYRQFKIKEDVESQHKRCGQKSQDGGRKETNGRKCNIFRTVTMGKKYADKSQTSRRYEVNTCSLRNTLCYSRDIKRSWINFVV